MFDGKEIAVQLLSEPIDTTTENEDHFLIMFKEWNPFTWAVSAP